MEVVDQYLSILSESVGSPALDFVWSSLLRLSYNECARYSYLRYLPSHMDRQLKVACRLGPEQQMMSKVLGLLLHPHCPGQPSAVGFLLTGARAPDSFAWDLSSVLSAGREKSVRLNDPRHRLAHGHER